MNNEYTEIVVVLDRSGSMSSCKEEAENGLNYFINAQKELAGKVLFTLVQFDNVSEYVHKAVSIKDVPEFKLVPRATTALYDTLGKVIDETGARLRKMPENRRPGLVVFAILTDGADNASHIYNKDQIKDMIEHQEEKYNWQWNFLGSNINAFSAASSIGIKAGDTLQYTGVNSLNAFAATSGKVSRARSYAAMGASCSTSYSDAERASSL